MYNVTFMKFKTEGTARTVFIIIKWQYKMSTWLVWYNTTENQLCLQWLKSCTWNQIWLQITEPWESKGCLVTVMNQTFLKSRVKNFN